MPKSGDEQYVETLSDQSADFEKRLNNLETSEPSITDPPDNGTFVSRNAIGLNNATNNYATVTYDTAVFGIDIPIATGVFTASAAGRWLIIVNLQCSTTGSSKFRLLLNGATVVWEHVVGTRNLAAATIVLPLSEGDTIAVQFANNASGTVTVVGTFGNLYTCSFQVELLVAD